MRPATTVVSIHSHSSSVQPKIRHDRMSIITTKLTARPPIYSLLAIHGKSTSISSRTTCVAGSTKINKHTIQNYKCSRIHKSQHEPPDVDLRSSTRWIGSAQGEGRKREHRGEEERRVVG